MPTAVSDRLHLLNSNGAGDELIAVREFLRLGTDADDALILSLIEQAKDEADAYLNNPFTDEDGDPVSIPKTVETWVLSAVARMYEMRVNGVRTWQQPGIGSVTFSEADVDYTRLDRYRLIPGV